MRTEEDISRLRPFVADSEEDGPGTVLVLKGFKDEADIHRFWDMLMVRCLVPPPGMVAN